MCNEVARRIALHEIRDDFQQLRIPLRFPEGAPNLAALDSIRITDTTAIVRADRELPDAAELVMRRWSWPGPGGRPVFNYRSEGRAIGNHGARGGRCLVPVSAFYEFTAPAASAGTKRKDKWRFAAADGAMLCVAGLWRADPAVGEAFTLLTAAPGPDVAPFHARQIVLLARPCWADWLAGAVTADALIVRSGPIALSRARANAPP